MKDLLVLFVVLGLVGSCKKDPPPAPAAVVPRPMPGQGQPMGNMNAPADPVVPPPPMPTGAELIQWDLPQGWSAVRAQGMRVATFKPAVAGTVDVSVIRLPGTAGGELGNVNRWRDQIKLPAIDEAARMKSRKPVPSKAGEFSLYDFSNESLPAPQRMVVGLLFVDGHSWFVKMVGDVGPVGASAADFEKLLASLRFPAAK
jgi:hypothetical protein